jgi:cell division protease FtsH
VRIAVIALAIVVVIGGLLLWSRGRDSRESLSLGEFEQAVVDGEIDSAEIKDRSNKVVGDLTDGTSYEVAFPQEYADELTLLLVDNDVDPEADPQATSLWETLLIQLLPIAVVIGAVLYIVMTMGGGKANRFGRAKAKGIGKDQPDVTFADVAGSDEAVEELEEIKDFLRSPDKFRAVGAKIPKGVLLVGPPGTGKTLLARAVAGEAGAPFFSISGSDFVEMYVGVGASRVRSLFDQAKAAAPAIVFVDEIDAVGRHRGAGLGGGHDEREQTLNQLLVEMDGFDVSSGVILIAATNRPDILDPALLRPGRFDRQIVVDRPDLDGRKAILAVHADGKPLDSDVDLAIIARRSPGFTGADIANLMNEAALLAARRERDTISMSEIEDAIDRVMAGPERRSRVMSERERRITAYHEGGHALVGHVLPNTDDIHKVSIVARGQSLGWTLSLPAEERYLRTRSELLDHLAMLLAGRTAEEQVFGDPTTGAHDDIKRATEIARSMVTEYGMSALGPRQLGRNDSEPFLGRDMGHEPDYSDEVAADIDSEVARLLDEAHGRAGEILALHRATLDRLADALVEHETLADPDLQAILGLLDSWPADDGRPTGLADGDDARGSGPIRPRQPSVPAPDPRQPVTSAEADSHGDAGDPGPPTFGGAR